jgi:hypothetical protein
MSDAEILKSQFVSKYKELGAYKFYRFLMVYSLNKLVLIEKDEYKGILPNLEFIEYHDKFIILYRREGDETYLEIAKLFRKIAHKVYRIMLKKNMTPPSKKFLTLV